MSEPSIPPMIEEEGRRVVRSFRASRIIVPVILGICAVAWLFYRQFDPEQFRAIRWSGWAYAWIGLSFLLLALRHLFYTFRLRTITGKVFSWRKCAELIVMWEFSAALTPTSKGGPFVMLFVLTREKLAAGRTAAAVFYTMVLDSGFFIITLPILLLLYGPPMLFPGMKSFGDVGLASGTFFVTYSLMLTYWSVLVFFLLIRPKYAKSALEWLSRRRLLQKWSQRLHVLGDEFALAATEIRRQKWTYHLQVIIGTIGAWTCKFIMINFLIIALVPSTPLDGSTQAFIYARLVAMFIIMAFSPTPGGAGLAEVALVGFITDYVPKGIGLIVALLWRGMAYYGYLLLGAVVVPAWIAGHVKIPQRQS
ncbi:MAG: flippase-like domain-containing protein [Saprospiraceae bacterium]|nr:flippase-like domain-containing protein [Saprospiraceae bacterium]